MSFSTLRFVAAGIIASSFVSAPSLRAQDDAETPSKAAEKGKAAEPKTPAELKIDACIQFRRLHKFDEAFGALREAAALNPPPPIASQVLFRTGETWFRKAQEAADGKLANTDADACYKESLGAFEELLKKYPKEESAQEGVYLSGTCHMMMGDLVKARELYQHAYDDYPAAKGRGRALIRVGVCQAGLDDPRGAFATFTRYLREFNTEADKSDRQKVAKYLGEVAIVGTPAPAIPASKWLQGMVGPENLKTFSGEVIVLVFFATWCENCSAEMPHLRSMIRQWAPKGVVFLGIGDPDDPKNTSPVDVYVQKNGIDFLDVALDAGARSHNAYRVAGLPGAAVIDRKGTIRWRGHLAFLPKPLLEKTLAEK
jgi:cytochrome c biogenesis protein CcmG/thiol:disulfide interchange protein DsbE